jgi:hypothetical protein
MAIGTDNLPAIPPGAWVGMDTRTVSTGHADSSRRWRFDISPMKDLPDRENKQYDRQTPNTLGAYEPRASDGSPRLASSIDLQTLIALSVGEWWDLGDHEWPPEHICRWLETAEMPQLRGLVLASLHRWQDASQHQG